MLTQKLRINKHYVYCITNIINNKKYIGSHSGELNDSYLGSGIYITKAVKKYGKSNFVKDILWEGPKEYMREMESYWCAYFDVANNNLFYNCTNKGTGWVKGVKNKKLSDYKKNMHIIPWNKGLNKENCDSIKNAAEKAKGRPSGMKGKVAWNKGLPAHNKGIKISEEVRQKLYWERTKVKCEVCGRLIGINNIKVHKRKSHEIR